MVALVVVVVVGRRLGMRVVIDEEVPGKMEDVDAGTLVLLEGGVHGPTSFHACSHNIVISSSLSCCCCDCSSSASSNVSTLQYIS